MSPDSQAVPSSSPRWEFARKLPNAPQIEPVSDEFFAGLDAPADKLVRESIQNSLDAKSGTGPVLVRFTIPDAAAPVPPGSPWLAGLAPHLQAGRNGLPPGCYQPGPTLSTLLVEDYGTCGLTGDSAQTDSVASEWINRKNNFFYFWRAVGDTGKGEGEKGSWGLGKSVLPASSRIHSFFGVSCEAPGGPSRLLGLSVLKHHTVAGSSATLTPYGYFGLHDALDAPVMPVHDADAIRGFCQTFGVNRQGAPGLSLVILDPLGTFGGKALIASAVVNYFFPILEGKLIVEVVSGSHCTKLDADYLSSTEYPVPEVMLKEHGLQADTLRDTLALARWSIEQRRAGAIRLNLPADARPTWEDEAIFAVDGWDAATARFAAGEAVEFMVPVMVVPKRGQAEEAEFTLTLKKIVGDQKARTFFLRDGITVGKRSDGSVRGLAAFAAIDTGPLAKLLRLSEDPSHTVWNEKSTRLTGHYENPGRLVRFIKKSVGAIHEQLTRAKEGIDADLLADLFFLEEEAADARAKSGPGGRGTNPQQAQVPKDLPTDTQPVRVAARGEGIALTGVPGTAVVGRIIRVRFAYDVRRGNPFAKWSKLDFDFAQFKGHVEWSGAQYHDGEGNILKFIVKQQGFEVFITGLDTARDVRVEANLESLS